MTDAAASGGPTRSPEPPHDEHLAAAALRAGPAGVIVTDRADRIALTNPATSAVLGVDVTDLVGVPVRRAIDERLRWRFTNPADSGDALLAALAAPDPRAAFDLETVDGRAVRVRCAIITDADGRDLGRVATISDISEARDALARATALAAERAQLLEREELRAHEEAALGRAAHMLASALTPADVHTHLMEQARLLVPACDKVAVLVGDRRGVVTAAAHEGFRPDTVARMVFRRDEGTVGRVMAGGRPFICNDTTAEPRGTSVITGPEGIRSFMHVPIVIGDRVYGLIALNSPLPRAFGERELRLVTELARHAASALQNALQFAQERHIAETLQRALTAGDPPPVAGLEIAALYRPATGVQVGGDICAVWRLPDGAAALLIGDVSGRGIEAAGLAVMVRHMAEALSRHHRMPGDLVTELNEMLAARLPDGSLVTLAMAVAEPSAGGLTWANAGHPAPVVLHASGRITTLGEPGPPCGAFAGDHFANHRTSFDPGDVLVLYTDGITEARRRGREFGEQALHELLRSLAHLATAELPAGVVRAVEDWCDGGLDDDVAVAVVRATGT
jgi:serine phosphatase RsbU (regulator of sigma subunit)